MTACANPSSGVTIASTSNALDEEWTCEDGDAKMVLVAAVFDWDRDEASSHDEGEAQWWYGGGDTVDTVLRERRNCESSSVEMQCDVQSRV